MCTPYIQRNRREEKFKILFHSLLSGTVSVAHGSAAYGNLGWGSPGLPYARTSCIDYVTQGETTMATPQLTFNTGQTAKLAGQLQCVALASWKEGAHGEDRALQALPVPDRLTWVSEEVPQGPPFNVARCITAWARPSGRGVRRIPTSI